MANPRHRGFNYENDGSILGLGDGGDSHRTAAVNLSIGGFGVGFSLFTGKRLYDDENGSISKHRDPLCIDNYNRRMPNGNVLETGQKYRFGGLYLSYKNYRIGVNSEHVRHAIQDQAIHNLRIPWFNEKSILDKRQMGFENQSWNWKSYFQYKTTNKFTSW
ncbi:polymorphic toxin type 23 domain-containing protein [Halpernia sp. GG3]